MNTPPFLVGCALLFWGWETGMLVLALPAAVVLEASRWINWRLDFEQDHYNRLWNLTVLLALGLALFLFFAQGGYSAVNQFIGAGQAGVPTESLKNVGNLLLRVVQLLPASMLLFMTAFAYGPEKQLPLLTYSIIYRRRAKRAKQEEDLFARHRFNPTHGFLVLLLLAVGASNSNPHWYFPCLAVLVGWTAWGCRPAGYRPGAWITAALVACGIGLASQAGLLYAQKQLELWQNRWINHLGDAPEFDTSQTRTSMGDIGRLKLSSRIVWWVQPGQENPPGLLQEAAFNLYEQPWSPGLDARLAPPTWTTSLRRFTNSVDGVRDPVWILNDRASPARTVTLTGFTKNGEVNIPHPEGTVQVTDLTASILTIQTNMLGVAMRAIGAKPLAILETRYGPGGGFASGPYEDDLSLRNLAPADERALQTIARQLHLKGASHERALALIRLFFVKHFDYTLDVKAPPVNSTNNTPLSYFLLERRKGHCEYFATATTLLLREAGIPSRYAVGYSVQEKKSGNEYVVRDRHAHAWALAWINHHWQEVDNTPAGWFDAEQAAASPWETAADWWSEAWLAFYSWRQGDSNARLYILIGGVLALGYLAWRQVAGKRWRKAREARRLGRQSDRLGLDSEFRLIQRALEKSRPRDASEPVSAWLDRLTFGNAELDRALRGLLDLHYRLRFDPAGLPPAERRRLSDECARWLELYSAQGN